MSRQELGHSPDEAGEVALRDARQRGEIVKCLAVRCMQTKFLFAHVVPIKGADEEDYAATLVVNDILWLGHVELIVRGDNERSLQKLVTRSLDVLRVRARDHEESSLEKVSREQPPAYDSQANGVIETGIRFMRGFFRTLRMWLEAIIGVQVPIQHALVPWLLQRTALLLNVQSRLSDGQTPWSRV